MSKTKTTQGGFFMVHKDVFDVCAKTDPASFAVFLLLARRQGKSESCFPHQSTIAADLGISIRTVQRAIQALRRANLINVTSECHQGNRYAISERYRADAKFAHAGTEQTSDLRVADDRFAPEQTSDLRSEGNKEEGKKDKGNPPKSPKGELVIEWPLELDTSECHVALQEWIQHRKQKGKPPTKLAIQKQLRFWTPRGSQAFIDAVEFSIRQDWTGIYPPKQEKNTNGHKKTDQLNDVVQRQLARRCV